MENLTDQTPNPTLQAETAPITAPQTEPSKAQILNALSAEPELPNQQSAPEQKQPSAPFSKKTVDFSSKDAFPELGSSAQSKSAFAAQWGKPSTATGLSKSSMLGTKTISKTTEIVDLPLGDVTPRAQPSKNAGFGREAAQKSSVSDVVKLIMSQTNTQIEVSRAAQLKTMTFIITGEPNNVTKAKREICSQLSPQVKLIVQIPAVVRRFLVGTRGQTLSSIQTQSGTRITLPPRTDNDESSHSNEKQISEINDDELMKVIDVTISGDVQGAAIAKAAIEEIVSRKTSKRGARLSHIPKELYPFISGPNNKRIKEWTEEFQGLKIRIPHLFSEESIDSDSNPDSTSINISGEREAVSIISKRIEELADELKRSLRTVQINLPKRQHRFIIGPKGANINEIMATTDCSVEVPPMKDQSTLITIRGPQTKLMDAMTKIMENANSVFIDTVDLTTVHSTTPNLVYGWRVQKYLQTQRFLKKLEQDFNINVFASKSASSTIKPTNPEDLTIELVGKDEKAVSGARSELLKTLKKLSPSWFDSIDIEPHLHGHLVGRNGANASKIKSQFGILILTPTEPENLGNLKPARSSEVILVYEGSNKEIEKIEKQKAKDKAIRDLISSCKNEISKTILDASNFSSETITIPGKFHRALIGPKGTLLHEMLESCGADNEDNRVLIDFGSTEDSKKQATTKTNKGSSLGEDQVSIKGPKKIVDLVLEALKKKTELLKQRETLYSFEEVISVPLNYLSRVIGKGGSGINRLSSVHDVQINVSDKNQSGSQTASTITIKGTKKGVKDAKEEVDKLVESLADYTTKIIKVAPEYHNSLIGTGGRFVRRLEERYGVSIKFPNNKNNSDNHKPEVVEGDDGKLQLAENEILVRGGSKGVTSATQEMTELAEYVRDSSYSRTITIPAKHLRYVVGRQGGKITEIRDESGARIDINRDADNEKTDSDVGVEVVLTGTLESVDKAEKLINEVTSEQELITEKEIHIDPKHHRYLIGAGGSFSRDLVKECGGDPELQSGLKSCKIFYPRAGDSRKADLVRVYGDKDVVEKVVKRLLDIVEERDSLVVAEVRVPQNQHAFIIGRGGSNLKSLQSAHQVQIHFSSNKGNASGGKKWSNDPEIVLISGKPDDVEEAKRAILEMVQEEKKMVVPLKFHQKNSGRDSGLWRTLQQKFGVVIDIVRTDQKPSKKAGPTVVVEDKKGEEVELIDQSDSGMDNLVAEWLLRGKKENLELASGHIEQELAKSKPSEEHYLLVYKTEPSNHKFIIGRGGSVIQGIRQDTGAEIDIPKANSAGKNGIQIVGTKNAVLQAKQMIDEIIEKV
ncbi:hypothetical protein BB559_000064 [Furculomyces boomerangus]|uniref:K Homology domain-containing protein n=2 Tax=Harpellales TaxID=61421 RepID=A0A2T9Z6K2_9FUNG|nr:hypothetical protein BB559_000064 [Furculomyces boomerangus]PVZ98957.1 hypothetical protein BB558_005039 [Smittium angustum]